MGSGTLITDGSFDLDLSSATRVTLSGTFRVANTNAATSGNLTVNLGATSGYPVQGIAIGGTLGSFSYDSGTGTYTVQGAGNDIWNTADQFYYVYRELTGDGTFTTRAVSVPTTDGWSKAGVMIRQSLDAGSPYALVAQTRDNNASLQWRDTLNGGAAWSGTSYDGAAPTWLRIDRSGSTLSMFWSDDGITWNAGNTHAISMTDPVYVGLAVTSHVNNTTLGTAVFDNVDIFGGGVPTLGNLRLDPSTQITLTGAGIAKFDSIGATGGLTINSNLEVGPTTSAPANIRGTGTGIRFNAEVTTSNFTVTGPGTVSLGKDAVLNIASGGKLDIPAGVTLSGNPGTGNTATINASQAGITYHGGLDVASGTLVLNAPASGVALPTGAYAHWAFDESSGTVAADSSGGSRNANLTGTAAWNASGGVIGGALQLPDGGGSWAVVPGTGNRVDLDNQSYSLSIWLQRTGTMTESDYWFGQGNQGATDRALHVGFRSQTVATLAHYADDLDTPALAAVGDGQWHNWVMTYDAAANTQRIWCDGVAVATRTAGGDFVAGGLLDFWIGGAYAGNEFGGLLDEALVYRRVLDNAEIQNLYRAGLQGGYGAARFGDLTMAPGTKLVASAPVGFSTATIGGGTPANPTTMTGDFTIDSRVAISGTGHLLVNGPTGNDGHLRIGAGLVYEWSFKSATTHDLIEVLGDLHFGGAFTLSIFGEGSSIQASDWIPVFLYSGALDAPGGLQYTIEIGNEADPRHLYLWDKTGAELFVGLHEGQQGIWLHGLIAQAVPEPGTLSVLALGALALLRRRRRKS